MGGPLDGAAISLRSNSQSSALTEWGRAPGRHGDICTRDGRGWAPKGPAASGTSQVHTLRLRKHTDLVLACVPSHCYG